ncbi:MAG: hypothetical protein H7A33_08255 [Deltaproteobacteria bacterium]|nr:hypothetical protein [Deltaproteobacteria bacterium]
MLRFDQLRLAMRIKIGNISAFTTTRKEYLFNNWILLIFMTALIAQTKQASAFFSQLRMGPTEFSVPETDRSRIKLGASRTQDLNDAVARSYWDHAQRLYENGAFVGDDQFQFLDEMFGIYPGARFGTSDFNRPGLASIAPRQWQAPGDDDLGLGGLSFQNRHVFLSSLGQLFSVRSRELRADFDDGFRTESDFLADYPGLKRFSRMQFSALQFGPQKLNHHFRQVALPYLGQGILANRYRFVLNEDVLFDGIERYLGLEKFCGKLRCKFNEFFEDVLVSVAKIVADLVPSSEERQQRLKVAFPYQEQHDQDIPNYNGQRFAVHIPDFDHYADFEMILKITEGDETVFIINVSLKNQNEGLQLSVDISSLGHDLIVLKNESLLGELAFRLNQTITSRKASFAKTHDLQLLRSVSVIGDSNQFQFEAPFVSAEHLALAKWFYQQS